MSERESEHGLPSYSSFMFLFSSKATDELTKPHPSLLVELGVFANPNYPLGKPYLDEYWKQVPISKPVEDVENRIMLYVIRNQILVAQAVVWHKSLRAR